MQWIFYLPGILFIISGIPQMIKLLKTKSSENISILMYLITLIAVSIVVVDAYIHKNNSILVSNLASLCIVSVNTYLIIKYRKK
ncbi:hypothetical protein A3B85_00015 [Candidatus Nomurabacteria bacterium RIFCSPHIGHO2_02_FULL_37_13]|uniref:Lipid A biosynthesis N-terminal domain-containing protein n=1 Tax=Candidatus Nomurabacteria bacterium RIFCSPHIGHO2_02_FULL_37_13 TaxID=1801750 RepID=A0A1F6W4S9_9BACT|nr:MAG: hypothetical protein A2640_02215 [Candidatus Nomurabacteria bacterium RIFCSPHIGHO2_01_FULL_36_23]OGI76913.1 MAG: hypothetical protein A3B85_00015 [Candidatus Nomurabacteria bacterium RIFCSPHIGHO2_02_FULL_37_13]OGI87444.1 MAG: hypothetical protein A2906_02675 [Candidatus Nomurabacteria bacterium RIFCSPLOWO2_01_FULL_37_25]